MNIGMSKLSSDSGPKERPSAVEPSSNRIVASLLRRLTNTRCQLKSVTRSGDLIDKAIVINVLDG